MDESNALGPTCWCCMHTVFPYGPNCPCGQKDKARFVSARFSVSAVRVRGFPDRRHTGFPAASIQVSPAVALQTGAGAGCRSRHASSRGRAVTAEAGAAAAGGAAEAGATGAVGGRCGGSRGGCSWRMQSLRRQMLRRWWRRQALRALVTRGSHAEIVY
jgi:hypothetical protein